jgi:hypothetical protein
MARPAVRVILVVFLTLAVAFATYHFVTLERAYGQRQREADAFDDTATQVIASVLELRASQRGYAADGQGPAYWQSRTNPLLLELRRGVDRLGVLARAGDVQRAVASLSEAVADTEKLERRIAEHAREGRRQHAADLIFADALEASRRLEQHAGSALRAAREEARAELRFLEQQKVLVAALASGAGLLASFALLPLPRIALRAGAQRASTARTVGGGTSEQIGLGLRVGSPAPQRATTTDPLVAHTAGPEESPTPGDTARLSAAADLCSELARVHDPRELSSVLARMSRVLDAQGTMLWLEDAGSGSLKPVLAHGYSADALAAMPGIRRDADNPTSRAFREVAPQVVRAVPGGAGAITVPLVSAAGCVGVVAAETCNGSEASDETLALARIFAAQLAALIAPAGRAEVSEESGGSTKHEVRGTK